MKGGDHAASWDIHHDDGPILHRNKAQLPIASDGNSLCSTRSDSGCEVRALAREAGRSGPDTSVILLWLPGGPPHMETYDMKPDAPSEYRGDFKPIKTNVPGIDVCEHLPQLAKCADKYSLVRSVAHKFAVPVDHDIPSKVIERYKLDVDRTLIRENLRRTPEKRLRALQKMQKVATEVRRAGRSRR